MTAVRISLPAEPTLVAAVLAAVARAIPGPVEVHASRDGAELTVEPVEVEPSAVAADAPSAAGAGSSAGPAPAPIAPHPTAAPQRCLPDAAPTEPTREALGSLSASTAPSLGSEAEAGAGAGEIAAAHGSATAGHPEPVTPPAGSGKAICADCGAPIQQLRTGRPRVFCHDCAQARSKEGQRRRRAAAKPAPVVPAHERPEKPVVLPVPAPAPEPVRPAAGNPLAVPLEFHHCEHCGVPFPDKKALGKHRAAVHPIRRTGLPSTVRPADDTHVVQLHHPRASVS